MYEAEMSDGNGWNTILTEEKADKFRYLHIKLIDFEFLVKSVKY